MKTIKLFLTLTLLSATSLFAQNQDSSWWRLSASLSPTILNYEDGSKTYFDGFGVEGAYAFNIANSEVPLFLELGLGLNYFADKESLEEVEELEISGSTYEGVSRYDDSTEVIGVKIPVSLAYRVSLSDDVALIPYAGVSLRFNVKAGIDLQSQIIVEDDLGNVVYDDFSSETINLLSDTDMNEMPNYQVKPMQLLGQFGLGLAIRKVYVGVNYISDITKIMDVCKSKSVNLSLGVMF